MEKTNSWVGIDVAKLKCDVDALIDGRKPRIKRIENTSAGHKELIAWLRTNGFGDAKICMEATGRYGDKLAEVISDAGFHLSVVNPARVKKFLESLGHLNKTDSADAAGIREYCKRMEPAVWSAPDFATRRLRNLIQMRDAEIEIRNSWAARLEAGLDDETAVFVKARVEESTARIVEAGRTMAEFIASEPELARKAALLHSIPCVSEFTVPVILAELPAQLPKGAKEAAAWAGLNPARRESGKFVGKTTISKSGRPRLRRAMFLASLTASQHNPAMKPFADRLRTQGITGKRLMCAVARKLLVLCCAVLRTGKPFDPSFQNSTTKSAAAT